MAELVIALDAGNAEEALALAKPLSGLVSWMKVGLELYTAEGPRVVGLLKDAGFKVFLDLKFHDIPNTVAGAVRSSCRMGVDLLDVHLTGGRAMLEAAVEARDASTVSGHTRPLLFGVTVLTSMSHADTALLGRPDLPGLVLDLARLAHNSGLDGVVCSAFEAAAVKRLSDGKLSCLTPGIRLASLGDDQKRVATPRFAVREGSDFLVVGRPITRAENPREAASRFLADMHGA